MTIAAPYLVQTEGRERDPFDYVPEFSRRARGFTVWAALRSLGRSGLADLVDRCCALARRFAAILRPEPGVEILNDVVLNQVLMRVPGDTAAVIGRVQREGTCWVGGTFWRDAPAIRFSVSCWATTEDDIRRSAASIARAVTGPSG